MSPTFSIITVTRNHASGLSRTLASIAAQENADFEVLVIDGNSSDHTPAVLREFAKLHLKIFQDTGNGVYAAMNQGVREAIGDWVIFMNAGDCFVDGAVLAAFNAPPGSDLVYGNAWKEDRSRAFSYRPFEEIWKGNVFCHQALFARLETLRRFPFQEKLRIVADYGFYVECLKAGHQFSHIDLDVALIEPGGISARGLLRRTMERYPIARDAFPGKPIRRYYSRLLLRQLGGLFFRGRRKRRPHRWKRALRRCGEADRNSSPES